MLDDPLRAQSLSVIAGCLLASIAVAGCAVLAFLLPQPVLGSSQVVMARESGALYVRIDDTLHPVPNLASARLVAGAPVDPEIVSAAAIGAAKRGPTVGIPGAPSLIGHPLPLAESAWTVCDEGATSVAVGSAAANIEPVAAPRSALVMAGSTTYLLYDGRRAAVDLRNTAVVRALRTEGVEPQRVSPVLLEALPEAPPITVPVIVGIGAPGPLDRLPVGTVVRSGRIGSVEHFVVLADGVQRIGELTADLIRFGVAQPDREIHTVAAAALAAAPVVATLPVDSYPERAEIIAMEALCVRWSPTGTLRTELLSSDSISRAGGPPVVTLAQADGDGPGIDVVSLPAGRSVFVRSTTVSGRGGNSGPLFIVTDAGVVFGVHDEEAARSLGLSEPPTPAPWPLLAQLPRGAELSRRAASVMRDSIASP